MEHATVVLPTARLTGGRAVREAYAPLLRQPGPDGRRHTKHHLTNVVVSGPDADGLVTLEAYYLVLEAGEDGPRTTKSGRFRDLLEPGESGSWRIREHHGLPDL
ncbi:nuclear transport factor 2 family protein [Ornithinimicrobium flavum]|uniref:nuclear transport factor 2 family protein n=1 Tax=Ornithinimicrobium flavum TaxID=1288636 RepID=UPI00107064DC|nr:nuclear transport factor 2 family protein [Ornithinimicrobium flavum]